MQTRTDKKLTKDAEEIQALNTGEIKGEVRKTFLSPLFFKSHEHIAYSKIKY